MDKFPSRARSSAATLAPRISAVVIASNMRDGASGTTPLDLCLRSALSEDWIDDLVVVDHDNPAPISSALRAFEADRRDVRVVPVDASSSVAAAANLGAREALGRWLLFLDADVVLQRGSVARMAAAAGGARGPWIVGGRLLDLDGRDRTAARAGSLNAFSAIAMAVDWPNRPRRRIPLDDTSATKVGAVSGAFMLIPRSDFNALSGFDPNFDTDYADLDLCRRASAAGGSVLFQHAAACVQFRFAKSRPHKLAQGLALFASKSAKTPAEKAFAAIAEPALAILVAVRNLVAGAPRAVRRPDR
ncbi:MAG: glycosyltransferase family 2 protein [Hyphomonadaceae bacterium]